MIVELAISMASVKHAGIDLFYMVAGHALCEFPLQGERMNLGKLPQTEAGSTWRVDHSNPSSWSLVLVFHCFINAAMVALITQSGILTVAELVLHDMIDSFNLNLKITWTQAMRWHLLTKVVYAVILAVIPSIP